MVETAAPPKDPPNSLVRDVRDWVDILFKIVLALAGAVVGYYFSYEKQQNDDMTLVVNMVTDPTPSKRLIAVPIAQSYLRQKRIPWSVFLAIYSFANSSGDDDDLAAAVNSATEAAVRDQPALQADISRVGFELPIRIFFHVEQDSDRAKAAAVAAKLMAMHLPTGQSVVVAPDIETIKASEARNVLKCFKPEECTTLGPEIVDLLLNLGVVVEVTDESGKYGGAAAVRPNHFEAWFAPGKI